MFGDVLRSYLEYICGASNVRVDTPMANLCTIKTGGPAKFYVRCTSKRMLVRLVGALGFIEYPYRIIGGASNIIVPDAGFDGVVIRLCFKDIVENEHFIYADAGASTVAVSRHAAGLGLSGLEFACGIPGTIGGAVVGNAGAFGMSMSDVVVMVDVLCGGEIVSMDAHKCRFTYRGSVFKRRRDLVIIGAYFALRRGDPETIQKTMQKNTTARLNIGVQKPNCGSIFCNPVGHSAGQLVERAGLKGARIGGAVVSEKHANFIVNDGGATTRDVQRLISKVQRRVRDVHGVCLKREVEILKPPRPK